MDVDGFKGSLQEIDQKVVESSLQSMLNVLRQSDIQAALLKTQKRGIPEEAKEDLDEHSQMQQNGSNSLDVEQVVKLIFKQEELSS